MRPEKSRLNGLWNAFDEATFGADRILNLRDTLPTAAEAKARTEVWLKARQVTRAEEVLIVTGRGNQSAGGIGVIRQAILGMLPEMRRRGVVEGWREHSPGSLVVKLAPTSALLLAGKRRRDAPGSKAPRDETLTGLDPETLASLRQLSLHMLDSLGVGHDESFVSREMMRIFSALTASLPETGDREQLLRNAIGNALEEGPGN